MINAYSLSGNMGVIDDVLKIADELGPFLQKLGITNDNGVIAARDKIAQYVTQIIGDRETAYHQLYAGYDLGHSDINNVGTRAYYTKVLERLNKAVLNYISGHAGDSSVIFGEEISPDVIMNRYVQNVKNGAKLDHAFWLAFTGKKDPFDLRTGGALPSQSQSSDPYPNDPAKFVTDVHDIYGKLLTPGTPEYNEAVKKQASAPSGNFSTTALLMVGGVLLLSGIAYVISKNKSSN